MILWRMQGLQYTHLYYFSTSDKHLKLCCRQTILYVNCCWGKICEEMDKGGNELILPAQTSSPSSVPEAEFQSSVWFCFSFYVKLAVYCSATTSKGKGEQGTCWSLEKRPYRRSCMWKQKGVRKQLLHRFAQNGSLQGEWAIPVLKI